MDKFEMLTEIIFRAPDDGKLWRIEIEENYGAGYNNIRGIDYSDNPEPEEKSFEAEEMEEYEKTVTLYRKIEDEG
jgi:hypothetical protein